MEHVELAVGLIDDDSLEAAEEWLLGEETHVSVGFIDGDIEARVETTAGYLLRLVRHLQILKKK